MELIINAFVFCVCGHFTKWMKELMIFGEWNDETINSGHVLQITLTSKVLRKVSLFSLFFPFQWFVLFFCLSFFLSFNFEEIILKHVMNDN